VMRRALRGSAAWAESHGQTAKKRRRRQCIVRELTDTISDSFVIPKIMSAPRAFGHDSI